MANINERSKTFSREHLFDLSDRVALVTGGGSGIGLMITQALATNGAKVYITGRTREKLDRVVETYGHDIPGQIIALPGDVSSKEGVRAIVDEFSRREQCLCILVNNAGVSSSSVQTQATLEAEEGKRSDKDAAEELRKTLFEDEKNTYEDWNETYNTNVTSVYFLTAALLPLLQHSSERFPGWSSTVVNISSISGIIKSAQHHFAYNASKAATVHLTRMLAAEVTAGSSNKLKIRVNGIAPGVYPSEMTTGDSDEAQKSSIEKEKYEAKVPAGRPGKDEDMAGAVLFAVCNQYLVGHTLVVDGGYALQAGH